MRNNDKLLYKMAKFKMLKKLFLKKGFRKRRNRLITNLK